MIVHIDLMYLPCMKYKNEHLIFEIVCRGLIL